MFSAILMSLLAATATPTDSFLRQYSETRRFTNGLPTQVRPTPDGRYVLFLRSEATSPVQSLYAFEVATGKTAEVLTAEALLQGSAQKLSVAERAQLERKRISARGFTSFDLSKDGKTLVAGLSGRLYLLDVAGLTSGKPLASLAHPLPVEGALNPTLSPDGQQLAYVKDDDVYVLDVHAATPRRLTTGGSERKSHGLPEFVAQEEMDRFEGFWWSPDGRHIAYEESDTKDVETFTIQDVARPEEAPNTFPYPRPGKANAKVRLGLVSSKGGPTTWVQWDAAHFPYLTRVLWPKHGPLTLLVQNRAQTEEVLLAVEVKTGATRPLLTETDAAWLNLPPSDRMPGWPHVPSAVPLWLEDGTGFFWLTEKHGGWEVEFHAPDGAYLSTWVAPTAHLVSLVGYDEEEKALYFHAAPSAPDTVVMRVRAGGSPERVFAPRAGHSSEGLHVSADASLRLYTTTAADGTLKTEVQNRAGKTLGSLPSVAQPPPFVPNVEYRQVGERGYWTAVVRPRNAVPGQKLPVLVSCYGGPHANIVQSVPGMYLLSQWQADQGFLVVSIDGRGTPRRDRAWERAIRDDFSGVILDDQVAGLQALAAVVPEMDMGRVGIAGWSFGGYLTALAILKRPDVFHAGVAGAPVVDWLDYDTYYTERYLGIPPAAAAVYTRNGLLPEAPNLQRPLLLLHGTSDDNVYFFHSVKLANALFRAGRQQFQFVPLSGFTHMVAEPAVLERLQRLQTDFLKAQLLQPVAPPALPVTAR
jgi:dipeptidyl-peptidase 4